jgi:hypothetical protein
MVVTRRAAGRGRGQPVGRGRGRGRGRAADAEIPAGPRVQQIDPLVEEVAESVVPGVSVPQVQRPQAAIAEASSVARAVPRASVEVSGAARVLPADAQPKLGDRVRTAVVDFFQICTALSRPATPLRLLGELFLQ